MTTRHFVTVWNPGYSKTSMEAHLEVLLGWVRRFQEKRPGEKAPEEEVYVWWGKVRSPHRQQPLAHLEEILSAAEPEESGNEQHLYLTDYRSLYVANVADITSEDPRGDDEDHVPAYYAEQKLNCDCWFQVMDIRRLVADDTVAVINELAQLRNTRYADQPVSIYGGMVEMPLIVTREPAVTWFGERSRDITSGKPWVQFDAEQSGTAAMGRELRENLLGEAVWQQLDPASRTFLATAESIFRRNREDPGFDFSPVVVNLAKAMEVQANLTLATLLKDAPPSVRTITVENRTWDLTKGGISIGMLARAVEQGPFKRAVRDLGARHADLAARLGTILREVQRLRNPAAHSGRVSLEDALKMRNDLLGVGCEGSLVVLSRATKDG